MTRMWHNNLHANFDTQELTPYKDQGYQKPYFSDFNVARTPSECNNLQVTVKSQHSSNIPQTVYLLYQTRVET